MVRGLESSGMVRVIVCLDLGFLDFLYAFCLGKMVRLAGAKTSNHLHYNCVILSLFSQKKKKHISKMTWHLTVKSNRGVIC